MATIRTCPYSGNRVIIEPKRLHRPVDLPFLRKKGDSLKQCPFEKGSEEATPKEIYSIQDNKGDWIVRVVPNLYHALSIEEEKRSFQEGFFSYEKGLGAHEVIIETPHHHLRADHYSLENYLAYLKAIIARLKDLNNDTRLEYIQVFKNCGKNAGATLQHPHSQIIATPFIPPTIDAQLKRCQNYYRKNRRSLFMDMVEQEILLKKRIVYENDTFVAFCPYASMFPFEVIIGPKTEIHTIETLTTHQTSALAQALKEIFKALYGVLGEFDYNMMLFSAPPIRQNPDPNYFYHIEHYFTFYFRITPRIYTQAGYELSTGVQINPIAPESATQKLKEQIQ